MHRSPRYPLHPNKAEEASLLHYLWASAKLYNAALYDRKTAWENEKRSVGYNEQTKELTKLRTESDMWSDVPVDIARSALRRCDLGFQAFFRRCKSGESPGYPRFKSWKRYDSFSFPSKVKTVRDDRVNIPGIGYVRFNLYRPIKGKVLNAIVKREAGKWYVIFQCDLGATPIALDIATLDPASPSIIGIDLGLTHLATLSTGERIANPRIGRKAAIALANRQRNLARKQRNSNSRKHAVLLVQKAYAKIHNQRKDDAWKMAGALVKRFDVICHEDLSIANMVHGNLAKHIYDASWALRIHAITCKAEEAGKIVIGVDPRGTSQDCSSCGKRNAEKKTLADREHNCEHCGLVLDRDHNAAINIEIRALGRSAVTELVPETSKARSPKRKKKLTTGTLPVDILSAGALPSNSLS